MHEGDPRGQVRARFAGVNADRMCTDCHGALAAPAAVAAHTRHDPAGAGARCVACHMPRIVYGVLDVHRSHRISVPRWGGGGPPPSPPNLPRRARLGEAQPPPRDLPSADPPDACTLCHVEGVPGGAPGVGATVAALAAEPVARAVAVAALGRAPSFDRSERARRIGTLLEAMVVDRYPAVRRLAWRSLRRLVAPAAAPGDGPGADYDPSGEAAARLAVVTRLRRELGAAAAVVERRAGLPAPDADLEIGE
jgi:hypothetical protein